MKILCIDSTTAIIRLAIVEDNKRRKEISIPASPEDWSLIDSGDSFFLTQRLFDLFEKIFEGEEIEIEDIDMLCYSGFSGYKASMNVGRIFCHCISKYYNIPYTAVDHITSHYFSYFINKEEDDIEATKFSMLFLSASGSHNSIAVMKNMEELSIFNDDTYFSETEGKYFGLGYIYYNALKICNMMTYKDATSDISKIISKHKQEIDEELVKRFIEKNENTGVFDLNFHTMYFDLKNNYYSLSTTYRDNVIFFSFEKAIYDIIKDKLLKIIQIIPINSICIVGGISMNDALVKFIEETFKEYGIDVVRPEEGFRLDNATMLGVTAYFMKKYDVQYHFSNHVT